MSQTQVSCLPRQHIWAEHLCAPVISGNAVLLGKYAARQVLRYRSVSLCALHAKTRTYMPHPHHHLYRHL